MSIIIPSPEMTIGDYLDSMYIINRNLRANSIYQYRVAVGSIERWSGEPVRLCDMCDELFNNWIIWLSSSKLAVATIRNRRRHVLALWQAAWRDALAKHQPRNLRAVKLAWAPPRAWTYEQVKFLLEAADRLEGNYPDERWTLTQMTARKIAKRVLWGLLIRIAWDTGMRFYDILTLKLGQIESDGRLEVVQRKTGRWHPCKVHPETLAFIRASYPPQREFIIPWIWSEKHFQNEFRRLITSAAIGKGTFKKLRKSSATEVEKTAPGCGGAHLGHATGGIAQAHYLDPRLLVDDRPMPRPLRELKGGGSDP